MKQKSIFKLVRAALFAALVFTGTQFIKVPLVFGYFNFGDPFVLLSGYLIGGLYGTMAAAIGSALADILSGYAIYAPVTLVIKAAMALVVFAMCRRVQRKDSSGRLVLMFAFAAIIAEIIMVTGYFLFESVMYGIGGALGSVVGNLLQGAVAVVTSTVIVLVLEKTKLTEHFRT